MKQSKYRSKRQRTKPYKVTSGVGQAVRRRQCWYLCLSPEYIKPSFITDTKEMWNSKVASMRPWWKPYFKGELIRPLTVVEPSVCPHAVVKLT